MFFPWTGTTEAAKDTTTTTLAAAEVVTLADEVNPLKNFLDQDKISILAISETHTLKLIMVFKFQSALKSTLSAAAASRPKPRLHSPHIPKPPQPPRSRNLHLHNMSILIISYYNL
jgi:hypothetical protein